MVAWESKINELEDQVLVGLHPGSWLPIFFVCSHMTEEARVLSVVLSMRAPILFMRLHLHDVITLPKTHLLIILGIKI